MKKKLNSWLFTLNLTFLLTLNLFLIITVVLAIVGATVWAGQQMGLVNWTDYFTPSAAAVVAYALAILIGISMVVMIHFVILKPVQGMVDAMKRLAAGDFSVRMTTDGWMSPLPLELRDYTEAFNIAAEELGGTELLRKDFVSNFSHEFKTPITSMAGFADLILEDDEMPAEERNEYLQIISSEAHRLANLSNSVLALSKVESQTILTERATFNLTEQLRQTVLMMEQKAKTKDITIDFEGEDCDFEGAEDLLKEVWVNLLDNAIKYSPEGTSVEVKLSKSESTDASSGAPSDITVTIQDHGYGMDEATQKHIFDQFYQGDTSHKSEGNGLGLAMVQKVVELHGGTISVESAPGTGSTFTVTLP